MRYVSGKIKCKEYKGLCAKCRRRLRMKKDLKRIMQLLSMATALSYTAILTAIIASGRMWMIGEPNSLIAGTEVLFGTIAVLYIGGELFWNAGRTADFSCQ